MKKFLVSIPSEFSQKFTATLSEEKVGFTFTWSEINQGWIYSVAKKSEILVQGRIARLNFDLFSTIKNKMKGELRLEGQVPTRKNLGGDCQLFYYEF